MVVRRSGSEAAEGRARREAQNKALEEFVYAGYEFQYPGNGKEYERDAIGEFPNNLAYNEAYKKLTGTYPNDRDGIQYAEVAPLRSLIKEHYDLNPTNPNKPVAKMLREVIIKELGMNAKEAEMLKFYTAVRSGALDQRHNVDGWFELDEGKGNQNSWQGIDVTMRPPDSKREKDIFVEVSQVPIEPESEVEKKIFEAKIREYTEKIIPKFKIRLNQLRLERRA